ncbi:MAG: aromatic ring-hydroxylating dioxygenase subunit alpha, partial [Gammaproteobacteria bacterium]|nr:aromatic ring-hydroxylating dioxygenase subunit alpha [Gammaproteobacteria bacterium]
QGNVWVYFGERPAAVEDIPRLPGLADDARYQHAECMTFEAEADHAVIGLMDPAHGPYVHRAWWWRTPRSIHEKQKRFEPSHLGFTMVRHRPSSNSRAYAVLGGVPQTEIAFRLPGVRIEQVQTERHLYCGLTAITPIDGQRTRVSHVMYWTMPWLNLFKPLVGRFARAFLDQDRRVVARQQQGLRFNPRLMLINDADQQARWYFQLKREYQRAMDSGEPFRNPVEAAILSWRS